MKQRTYAQSTPSAKGIKEHNVLKKHIFRAVPDRCRPAAKSLRRSSNGKSLML
jgi:hypothetical protein